MENVLLDSKVLINNREVLTQIQKARRELQGIEYQISADARRWAIYQQYVQAKAPQCSATWASRAL